MRNPHEIFADYFKGSEAIAYILSKRLADGNICIAVSHYDPGEAGPGENTPSAPYIVSPREFETQLRNSPYVSEDENVLSPFIRKGDNLYLHRYYTYESRILNHLAAFDKSDSSPQEERLEAFENACEKFPHLFDGNDACQLQAARSTFLYPFSIITGGPGTGKTTTIARIMLLLLGVRPGIRIGLAAPTGKAAARMNESLTNAARVIERIPDQLRETLRNLKALTIHKLLGTYPNKTTFRHHAGNPLPYDLIVIDESSMIDVALMSKLLEATAFGCHVILLGDKDQLASVEAGSIFGDLCQSAQTPLLKGRVTELLKSHRFDPDKGIGLLSRSVISGNRDALSGREHVFGEVIFDYGYQTELLEKYALLYRNYICEEDISRALRKMNDVRILCAVRESDKGVYAVNRLIESLLRNSCAGFNPEKEFYHNRPVMITRNDYILDLRNGDVGIIREVTERGGKSMYAFFEGSEPDRIRKIPASLLPDHETVFAMTIHKSQGSEFDKVVVILPDENAGRKILSRELFYTAITRAKTGVLVQSSPQTLDACFQKCVTRSSGIMQRLADLSK